MKTCFILTSSIDISEKPLSYSPTRSVFSKEERFRQTMYSVSSIKSNYPDAKIFMVDSSKNYHEYEYFFSSYFGIEYYPLEKYFPHLNYIVNNHAHKSYCESLKLRTFMREKYSDLLKYDLIFKACGRYVYEINTKPINPLKFYFKHPTVSVWQDSYNELFSMVDRRSIENDNYIRQYSTILYAYGSFYLKKMINLYENIIKVTSTNNMYQYDTELLHYFYSREFEKDVIETDWVVSGYQAPSGTFVRY